MAEKKTPYWQQAALVAPAFGAKAILGDWPEGALEHAVTARAGGSSKPWNRLFAQGFRGRGGGRALGGIAGITTAPLYLKGLQMAGSKDPSERHKGIALLAGSSAVFAGQKGALEGLFQHQAAGASRTEAVAKGLHLGLSRSISKIPFAVMMGMGVAAGRHDDKESPFRKYVMPGVTGAALGGLSRASEDLGRHMSDRSFRSLVKALPKTMPAAAGGAAGGLFGGLVLAKVVDMATKTLTSRKKEASVEKVAFPVVEPVLGALGHLAKELPILGALHQAERVGFGYGRAGRWAARIPGVRRAAQSLQEARSRHMAIGIREGLAGKADLGWRGGLMLGATVPELAVTRHAGRGLGRLLRNVPEGQRERVLDFLKRNVETRPTLMHTPHGDPTPVLNSLPDAVDRAVGRKALTAERKTWLGKKLQAAYDTATLGGRDVLGPGLPFPRHLQAASKLREHGPNVALAAAGVPLALGAGAPGLALGTLGAHLGFGGVKGLVVQTSGVKRVAKRELGSGLARGIAPGAFPERSGSRVKQFLAESFGTPSAFDAERMFEAGSRTVMNDVMERAARVTPAPQRTALDHLKTVLKHPKSREGQDVLKRFTPAPSQQRLAAMAALGGGGVAMLHNRQNRGAV